MRERSQQFGEQRGASLVPGQRERQSTKAREFFCIKSFVSGVRSLPPTQALPAPHIANCVSLVTLPCSLYLLATFSSLSTHTCYLQFPRFLFMSEANQIFNEVWLTKTVTESSVHSSFANSM